MLCHRLDKHWKKANYLCYTQPKLDGVRCINVPGEGFYSRNGKKILGVPHIEKMIAKTALGKMKLDGELFADDLSFNDIQSTVCRTKNIVVNNRIRYWIFDVNCDMQQVERSNMLREAWDQACLDHSTLHNYAHLLLCDVCHDRDDIDAQLQHYVNMGYEGLIYRNIYGFYEEKRSYNLMKLKPTRQAILEVVGFVDGKGKHKNTLGSLQCIDKKGIVTFVGSGLSDDDRDVIWSDKECYYGCKIVVEYQEKTPTGALRFPTFKQFIFV